jgi:hypothetical protein
VHKKSANPDQSDRDRPVLPGAERFLGTIAATASAAAWATCGMTLQIRPAPAAEQPLRGCHC